MRMTLDRCMRDPRRRFMFGYTLAATDMDFWYVDQAGAFRARSFEWIDDVSTSSRLMLV